MEAYILWQKLDVKDLVCAVLGSSANKLSKLIFKLEVLSLHQDFYLRKWDFITRECKTRG